MYRYTLLVLLFAAMIAGCSGGGNPVVPQEDTTALDGVPVIDLSFAGDMFNAIGLMGAYELTIDPDEMTAELVAKRTSAVGEGYIVSGINFFTMAPCANCLQLIGLNILPGEALAITFWIKHAFAPGNPGAPPSAVNRLDLDVFDLAMVIDPKDGTPAMYPLIGASAYSNICVDPDGYTRELKNVINKDAALPYFLVIDNSGSPASTWNRFAMGASAEFDIRFALVSDLKLDLYLTMGYGASAQRPQRLQPKYYNPEFNRKAAWKVEAAAQGEWFDNDNSTTIDVEVKVYDWQQGATVYGNPADFHNAPNSNIYASSNVALVSVEIPGMTNTLLSVTTAASGTGMHNDPLIFRVPIANQNLLPIGQYQGLVKVTDQRSPGVIGDRDFLIDTPDGIALNNYTMPEYATYQTFVAVVQGSAGNLVWAKRAGGTQADTGFGITTLSDNSTVVTGSFRDTATFGEGEPNQTVLTSAGWTDIFIARYNPNGTLAWAKRAGGTHHDAGQGITALSDNSTVVTGYFHGTATFGPGEPNETVLTSAGSSDIFIARYNPDGTLAWAKNAGGMGADGGNEITTLSDNSTVVTGFFESTAATFGPGEPNETVLTTAGLFDIFIARYNPNGTLAWAKRAGGWGYYEGGSGITTLSDDSTVVTGVFSGTATFGEGEPNQTSLTSVGGEDIFIARYNPNGTLAWAKRAGGSSDDSGLGITTLSDNSTVVTGRFFVTATFGEGEPNQTVLTSAGDYDIFIARYNPDGTLLWAKRAGGSDYDEGAGITTLSDNSLVVTGWFRDIATFGLGEPNETVLTSAGDFDIFIARYNHDGTLFWAKRAGGTGRNIGLSITTLSDNSTVVTGYFNGTATFGPGEPNETELISAGDRDIFIARFEP